MGLKVITLLLRFRCAGVVSVLVVAAKGISQMRVTRTMFASAAVAAAVALSAPAAHAVSVAKHRADGGSSHGNEEHGSKYQDSEDEGHGSSKGEESEEEGQGYSKHHESKEKGHGSSKGEESEEEMAEHDLPAGGAEAQAPQQVGT